MVLEHHSRNVAIRIVVRDLNLKSELTVSLVSESGFLFT